MATDPRPPIGEDDLHALVDGQLDPARLEAVERHLAERPEDAARVAAYFAQRDTLRAVLDYKAQEPIPARLRVAHLRAARRTVALRRWRMTAAASVLLMIGGGLGWLVSAGMQPGPAPMAAEPIAIHRQVAVASAPRMEALARDTDIGAWLEPRLGEVLPPPDLTRFGFALEVAWVLPGSDGPAAMLRYVDPEGTTLSLWRRPSHDPAPRELRCVDEPGGLLTYSWSDGQRLHVVTAAMPRDRLRPIAQFVERVLEAPPPPGALVAGLPRRPCDAALG